MTTETTETTTEQVPCHGCTQLHPAAYSWVAHQDSQSGRVVLEFCSEGCRKRYYLTLLELPEGGTGEQPEPAGEGEETTP